MKINQFVLIIILSTLILSMVSSQIGNVEKQIDEETDKLEGQIKEIQNNITDLKNKSNGEFLAEEWTKFFRESKAFNWIYKLNPIFKFFIGQEFSISWKFITGLLIWLIVLFIFLGSLDMIFESKLFVIPTSLIISALTSQLAVPFFIDKIVDLLKKGSEQVAVWINFGTILILLCLIFLIRRGLKELKKYIYKKKFEKRVQRAEEATEAINKSLSKAERMKEGMEEEINK